MKGDCAICGQKNVDVAGMYDTGSQSGFLRYRPACSWCFYRDDEPTKRLKRDVLERALELTKEK